MEHGHDHQEDKNEGFSFFYPALLATFVIFLVLFLNSSFVVGNAHECECADPAKCEHMEGGHGEHGGHEAKAAGTEEAKAEVKEEATVEVADTTAKTEVAVADSSN